MIMKSKEGNIVIIDEGIELEVLADATTCCKTGPNTVGAPEE